MPETVREPMLDGVVESDCDDDDDADADVEAVSEAVSETVCEKVPVVLSKAVLEGVTVADAMVEAVWDGVND